MEVAIATVSANTAGLAPALVPRLVRGFRARGVAVDEMDDLARLLDCLGEAEAARALYRKALEQVAGRAPELPLPSPRRKSVPAQAPEPPPDVLPIEQAS